MAVNLNGRAGDVGISVLESFEMRVAWKQKFRPALVVERLERERKSGNPRLALRWYLEIVPLVITGVEFKGDLTEAEKHDVVANSLLEFTDRDKKLSPDQLLADIASQTQRYARRRANKYTFLTDWSVAGSRDQSRSIFDARIQIGRQVPRVLAQSRQRAIEKLADDPYLPRSADTCPIRVTVWAKSAEAAFFQAFDAQDLIRGIRNLCLNRGLDWMGPPRPPQPMNKILVGPLHLVVEGTSSDKDAKLWYETDCPQVPRQTTWTPAGDKFERKVLTRIRASTHGRELADGIRRYNRALDKTDVDGRYLALWSVLEFFTGTDKGIAYDQTVRRAAYVGASGDYDLVVLSYLRNHRNDLAHRDEYSGLRIRHTIQLKRYVESLILFLLDHSLKFKNWQELLEVLDSPTDAQGLAARRDRVDVMREALAIAKAHMRPKY